MKVVLFNLKLLGIMLLFTDLSLQEQNVFSQHKGRRSKGNIKITSGGKTKILHRQKRAWVIDTFELEEELPGPYPKLIGTVNIDEGGTSLKYSLRGIGVDEDPKGLFHINEDDGSIYVHQKIDFEKTPIFRWAFHATNRTSLKVGTKLGIQLKILDINDNIPEFGAKTYTVSVNESFSQGVTFFTLIAYDMDEHNGPNSLVNYKILSQTPADPNVEFTINKESGFLSFKGCLNYEKNKNYKLVIQAKDNGVLVQQSSSCEVLINVIDRNTHMPEWITETFHSKVVEREANVTIMRLGVKDGDTPYTSGWRAVYTITAGNDMDNYKIETDPKTNEGIVTVIKALDYETSVQTNLSITVANEEPLYTCKVLSKPPTGLWVIESNKSPKVKNVPMGRDLMVDVIDANDPPIYKPEKIVLTFMENSMEPGSVLGTVNAVDADIISPNRIRYVIENDPGDWLSIDENTGVITSKAVLDRESEFVLNSKYIVKVLAIDDGVPPMTGTATLIINLKDENDNVPKVESAVLATCENNEEIILITPVIDRDLDPYSGPFYFEVLDKDADKKEIKLMESNGDVLKVMKMENAKQGNHTLHLEIYDRQGVSSLENFTIFVCDCLEGDACVEKLADPPSLGGGAIALLLLAPVLFIGLTFLLCKVKTKEMVPVENEPLNSIIVYNEEGGNIDCQASAILTANLKGHSLRNQDDENDGMNTIHNSNRRKNSAPALGGHIKPKVGRSNSLQAQSFKHDSLNNKSSGAFDRSTGRRHSSYHREKRGSSFDRTNAKRHSAQHIHSSTVASRKSMKSYHSNVVDAVIKQKLRSYLDDFDVYKPKIFAEEGELSKASSLDEITIAGSTFRLDSLHYLGSKFNILESICAERMLVQPNVETSPSSTSSSIH
ncbi:cadherin-like protein 26 [Bombina bombina]|uniref:cadherin-like protein 26 n=1 Tax=Bombina bombina TaxID=8345 RepID=UPI00235A612B|nr:cadherin-like protein 26 [Bombina bombina]